MNRGILRMLMDEADKGGGAGGGDTPPAAPLFETIIPEDFKEKAYLSDLKKLPVGPDGYKALFKKLDGAQVLLGKKTGIPEAGAPKEEWEKFHGMLRPAKADEYELADGGDPKVTEKVKAMFHDAGLSKSQASKLAEKFNEFATEQLGSKQAEEAKLDAEFKEMTEKAFGADNAKVIERSKQLLDQLTPANLKPHLVKLPNESLVLLAGVMESVRTKFLKEDGHDKGGSDGSSIDVESLRDEARKLMLTPEWKDPFNRGHADVKAKVDSIYAQIGKVQPK